MMRKLMVLTMVTAIMLSFSLQVSANEAVQAEEGQQRERLHALIMAYSPDMLEEFEALEEAHTTFHMTAKVDQLTFSIEKRQARLEIWEEALEGLLSRQEAKDLIEDLNEAHDLYREEVQALKDSKSAELLVVKTEFEAVRLAIKEALMEEVVDDQAIVEALASLLELGQAHLDIDYKYAELLEEVRATY